MAEAVGASILISDLLSESRFKFALKCLKNVMQIKKSENVVFSPYSLYEGLLLIYFASSGITESYLKRILHLYENIPQKKYMLHDVTKDIRKGKKLPDCYEKNSCWITNTRYINDTTQCLFTNELEVVAFDKDSINLKNRINELLRLKTQGYINKPVKLNVICENMEIILSTVIGFRSAYQQDSLPNVSNIFLMKQPKTVLSPNLGIFVTELPCVNKTLSLFLLFPAAPDSKTERWTINKDITELIDRLTTTNGVIELRRILDNEESATVQLSDDVIYPDFFELEDELPINQLLEMLDIQQLLEPDKTDLSNFTNNKNLHLGGAKHCAYIKVTRNEVTAGAVNLFFTKNEASFKPSVQTDRSKCKNVFICLLYCRYSRSILLISVIKNKSHPLSLLNNLVRSVSFVPHIDVV